MYNLKLGFRLVSVGLDANISPTASENPIRRRAGDKSELITCYISGGKSF